MKRREKVVAGGLMSYGTNVVELSGISGDRRQRRRLQLVRRRARRVMQVYHRRYSEQIETANAEAILSRWR